jgi:hypothetical protein
VLDDALSGRRVLDDTFVVELAEEWVRRALGKDLPEGERRESLPV